MYKKGTDPLGFIVQSQVPTDMLFYLLMIVPCETRPIPMNQRPTRTRSTHAFPYSLAILSQRSPKPHPLFLFMLDQILPHLLNYIHHPHSPIFKSSFCFKKKSEIQKRNKRDTGSAIHVINSVQRLTIQPHLMCALPICSLCAPRTSQIRFSPL